MRRMNNLDRKMGLKDLQVANGTRQVLQYLKGEGEGGTPFP